METIQAQTVEGASLDGALENAATNLADSLTSGLKKRRSSVLLCVLLWALSLPAHVIVNGL
jgi:hypothetical protein